MLSDVFSLVFFEHRSDSMNLLKSFTIYASAFMMRPLGGICIGLIGDVISRRRALEISIACMIFPSFLIGILPTYPQIGVSATISLSILRLMQGFAVGGELVGAWIYSIEQADSQKGLTSALVKASGCLGASMGMGLVLLLRVSLTQEQMLDFGWRLPFIFSIAFGAMGVFYRSQLDFGSSEKRTSADVEEAGADASYKLVAIADGTAAPVDDMISTESIQKNKYLSQLTTSVSQYYPELLVTISALSFWCVSYYTLFVWMQYFLTEKALVGSDSQSNSKTYAYLICFIMNLLLVGTVVLGGLLSDNIGTKIADKEKGVVVTLKLSIMLMIFFVIPAFSLLNQQTVLTTVLGLLIFVIIAGLFGGNLGIFMVLMFPVKTRYVCMGLSYNIANAIFSGTAAIINTCLVMSGDVNTSQRIRDNNFLTSLLYDGRYRPAYYIIAISCVSLATLTYALPYVKTQRSIQRVHKANCEAFSYNAIHHMSACEVVCDDTKLCDYNDNKANEK